MAFGQLSPRAAASGQAPVAVGAVAGFATAGVAGVLCGGVVTPKVERHQALGRLRDGLGLHCHL
jgi:hypothetical protein